MDSNTIQCPYCLKESQKGVHVCTGCQATVLYGAPPGWCVFLVIVLISCLSAGSYFWALVCLVVLVSIAKYCLHNQILYIYFANGYAKIPEETSEDNDVEPLVSYIRQYNPNITKIEIAN